MMLPTHILVGIFLGALVSFFSPITAVHAMIVGALGGVVPDVDMILGEHRQTLHYPVHSMAVSLLIIPGIYFYSPIAVGIGIFSLAAGLHCWMDYLGGGKELRPWEQTDDRAVYNHVTGNWLMARRLFYSGSTTDLLISTVLAVLLFPFLNNMFQTAVILLIVAGFSYTALLPYIAKWIPDEYDTLSSFLKQFIQQLLPNPFPSR